MARSETPTAPANETSYCPFSKQTSASKKTEKPPTPSAKSAPQGLQN